MYGAGNFRRGQETSPPESFEEDEDFENGDNKKEGTELDIMENNKELEDIISEAYANFNEQFNHMSIKQKTNYFIINTVLMSVCHCLISGYEKELEEGQGFIKGLNIGVIKKAFRYQLGSGDVNHIMDMSEFYKKNQDLCVTDVTNGKRVQIKVTEYDPDLCKKIKRRSGYDDQYMLKSFAPKANHIQMTRFQIGSGKSDSFFFYTANNQLIYVIVIQKIEICGKLNI